MALNIVRFQKNDTASWGLLSDQGILPINLPCASTAELLAHSKAELVDAAASNQHAIDPTNVELLSPITRSAKVLCQGANYRQHMIDSGVDPDAKKFNMFFTKSSASITGPEGSIIKPQSVTLLDYEIELTLVLGKQTRGPEKITHQNLHQFVAGICIGNDVSARDIQIPQMQFHKGKSYRTFCPLGPVLCLLEPDELHYLNSLELSLEVNGQTRQQDSTENLVFKPAETLTELSQIHDFEPGDVVMTGTPSGCALGLPSPFLVRLVGLLPEQAKWNLFIKKQQARAQYLKAGDEVVSSIVSRDGVINLGTQRHTVVDA